MLGPVTGYICAGLHFAKTERLSRFPRTPVPGRNNAKVILPAVMAKPKDTRNNGAGFNSMRVPTCRMLARLVSGWESCQTPSTGAASFLAVLFLSFRELLLTQWHLHGAQPLTLITHDAIALARGRFQTRTIPNSYLAS